MLSTAQSQLPAPNPPTPQELIADGLYKDLAKSCFPGRHRQARVLSPPHLALRTGGTLTSQGAPVRRCRSRFWQRTSARLPLGRAASQA